MNTGGDAAEQVVRLSLEGFEVAAKLTGTAAKELAVLLVSVLKQEHKTKGKARLTSNQVRSSRSFLFLIKTSTSLLNRQESTACFTAC